MAYLTQEGNLGIVEKITALDTPSHKQKLLGVVHKE